MENFVLIHSDSSHHHHGGFVAASLASPVMEPLSLRLSFLHKLLYCLLASTDAKEAPPEYK